MYVYCTEFQSNWPNEEEEASTRENQGVSITLYQVLDEHGRLLCESRKPYVGDRRVYNPSLANMGIKVWAIVKEKTSLGATTRIFGVKPLKKAVKPSLRSRSRTIVTPPTLESKLWFCTRVLMLSRRRALAG